MYRLLFITINLFVASICFSQNSAKISLIDSIVNSLDKEGLISYQKIEKNRTWASHSKNLDKVATIYKFTEGNVLTSYATYIFSQQDTEIYVALYFDSAELIKAKSIYFGMGNSRGEDVYYFDDKELINKEMEFSGMRHASYYVELASRIQKGLKRRKIRFPSF